jgi:hypothetical protein
LTATEGANECPIYDNAAWRDCATGGDCNASCAVDCGMAEPTVEALIAILNAGEGTFTIPSSPNNGSIAGTPAITIVYKKPNILEVWEQDFLRYI